MAYESMFGKPKNIEKMGWDVQGLRLQDLMGLISGRKNPWDTAQWAPQVQGMRTQGELGLSDIGRNLREAGVTGPAAALTLGKADEGISDNVLNLSNMMTSGINKEAWEAGNLASRMKQMRDDMIKAKMSQPGEQGSTFEDILKGVGVAGNVGTGVLGGVAANKAAGNTSCCFIFLEGNNGYLEDSVRTFRDKYFSPDSWVSKGYKRMARWLVPMMKRSKIVKQSVRFFMLDPLARVARWHEGTDKLGWLFVPVGVFWCFIWGESARLREVV